MNTPELILWLCEETDKRNKGEQSVFDDVDIISEFKYEISLIVVTFIILMLSIIRKLN